jgi:hypothetical protein
MQPVNSNSNIPIQKRKLGDITNVVSKKKRVISSYVENKAPSVSKVNNLTDGIMEHAHLRLQMFYVVAIELAGVAKRTNGDITNINTWVGRATKQDGQGTRQEHAAHSNAAAGLSDDLKENYIQQIIDDGITPVKASFLSRIRKISDQDLVELHNNHTDSKFVRDIVDMVWQGNSAIAGTELEDQINATDKLPRSLNLQCDLPLEKSIRPYIAELMSSIMKGELEPRGATTLYTKAIQDHFEVKIKEISKKIKALKNEDMVDVQMIKKWEEQLFFHQTEMNGTNTLDYNLMDGPKRKIDF